MMITCIKCKSEIEIQESSGRPPEIVTCPRCNARFKVKWKMEVEAESELPPSETADIVSNMVPAGGLKVLVAVDGEATREVMNEVLVEAGYQVLLASTGQEALSVLEKERPAVAYLDVALPQVLGFEVCEIVKKSHKLKETKVVLVAAIYDKTRYKRAPSSLYGADDYIERHHIHDGLIPKLNKMLSGEESHAALKGPTVAGSTVEAMDKESLSPRNGVPEAGNTGPSGRTAVLQMLPEAEAPDMTAVAAFERPAPAPPLTEVPLPSTVSETAPLVEPAQSPSGATPPVLPEESGLSPEDAQKDEEAKRFARLIISDIALYNQKAIEEGIENGNVEDLLKDEMAEADKLFRGRISKEWCQRAPYLKNALRDLVERKKKLMQQGK